MALLRTTFLLAIGLLLSALGCKPSTTSPEEIPAFAENGVNIVVEIPAGTNHKLEYNKETGQFENDIKDGQVRIINFLPYPGNYGFVPSTLMDSERGGDGDALDVLVIGESQPTGTVMQVKPIAMLELLDEGKIDNKLIAIPVDASLQVLPAQDFQALLIEYDAAKRMIESWFLNYKGFGAMELVGWKDEKAALAAIKKWMI
ncbi:MAG: inorganic diphosphatase [Bacteroidota bacterium]